MALRIDVLTLFPPMVEAPLRESIPARILERGLAEVHVHDLRGWGIGRHRQVDDYTYGGGAGMVLRPEPVAAALAELRQPNSTVILLDPGGQPFRQPVAHELALATHLVFLCPRYEGVDERIRSMVDREISIGDFVLTGGELAALVVIDAVLRLLPGAIDEASTTEESFASGLLEIPSTRARRSSTGCPSRPSSYRATTSRYAGGGCASRCAGRSTGARICSTAGRRRPRSAACWRSCATPLPMRTHELRDRGQARAARRPPLPFRA